MEFQQVDLMKSALLRQPGGETGCCLYIVIVIIEAGDQRHPQYDMGPVLDGKLIYVLEYPLVGDAGEPLVYGGVHMLDVVQKCIRARDKAVQRFRRKAS